jgi:HPt (histidine-containing phosphotransfer) domain-containing protein
VQTIDADVVLDLEQLRNLTLDDRKLMSEIVWALIDDTSRQSALLDAAVRDLDAQRSIRLARSSTRACSNLGASAAAAALQSIGRGAALGDFALCHDSLLVLRAEIDRLRAKAASL